VAVRSRFKCSLEISSNFRTFLLPFHNFYGGIFPEIVRKISDFPEYFGNFSCKNFPENYCYLPEISGKIQLEISQLTTLIVTMDYIEDLLRPHCLPFLSVCLQLRYVNLYIKRI